MKLHSLVLIIAALFVSSGAYATPLTIIDTSTQGFYNNALGETLNGTNPIVDDNSVSTFLFPNNNSNPNDPVIASAPEPDLSAAASILGDWLGNPGSLNANWSGLQAIPTTWTVNSETAIVYEFDAGTGLANVSFDFGVDNGIFVWLDGVFMGGHLRPGGSSLGEFMFDVSSISAGTHYLQILREDHGGGTGYDILVQAEQAVPEPVTVSLLGTGLLLLGFKRRPKKTP